MEKTEDKVGYRKPPGAGRFQKGKSGNPRGRPRKKADTSVPNGADPLRSMIQAELSRKISVTDADGQKKLTALEVTLRSLTNKAMQGGILAQRDVLAMAAAEAEIAKCERQKTFDYWKDYKETAERAIEIWAARGEAIPELLPHPNDLKLDNASLTVKCWGAVFTEEHRETQKEVQKIQDFAYEMSIFLREKNIMRDAQGKGGTVGIFFHMYRTANGLLPARLRRGPADYESHLMRMAGSGRYSWGKDFDERCAKAGFPSWRAAQTWKAPPIPLAKFGIKFDKMELITHWLQEPRKPRRKSG